MEQSSAKHIELLHVCEAVASDKNIDREIVFEAMEEALQRAAGSKYGFEHDIRVKIDRESGALAIMRHRLVSEIVENTGSEVSLLDAQKRDKSLSLGDELIEELPIMDFSRVGAGAAKQIVLQKMREAEREKQYQEFKDRKGEIVTGIVKRTEFGNVTIDFGTCEGYLPRDQVIQRENHKRGDRISVFVVDVSREVRGPQVYLSRTNPGYMIKLFTQEVPEVYEGTITIRGCSRDPGSRAKMSVYTSDPSIDPVGACIGIRGSRVQAVTQELQGERVDIIRWSEDIATHVVNALAPAEVIKVIIDSTQNKVTAVVTELMLSKAIGRRGQNVRLASELTGVEIDIISEAEEAERRNKEQSRIANIFMEVLDADEVIARYLVTEGFDGCESLAAANPEDLQGIEGFSPDLASEIIDRARKYINEIAAARDKKLKDMQVEMRLVGFCGLEQEMVLSMAEELEVRTVEDLAGLTPDELVPSPNKGALGQFGISSEDASNLIMEARVDVGWVKAEDLEVAQAPEEAEASETPAEGAETAEASETPAEASEAAEAPAEAAEASESPAEATEAEASETMEAAEEPKQEK